MKPDVSLVVEQSFDFIGSVLVPVAAILTSAAIAIFIAARERRSAEKAQVRAQAARLIQALNAVGRATLAADVHASDVAYARYEQELNAFAAYLDGRDIVVAKFVCVVVDRFDRHPNEFACRTMLWVATSLELWARGVLTSRDFRDNMPRDTTSWVENINLGEWDTVLRGRPAQGVADITSTLQ